MVTHDLEEAEMLADRMAVIHRGRILQQGSPEAVMRRPANSEVARLVDVRNLFSGEITDVDFERGTCQLRWAAGMLEARWSPGLPEAGRIDWCVPPSGIVLHSRVHPSRGEEENPVSGKVREIVRFGGRAQVLLAPGTAPDIHIWLDLPQHVIHRNCLRVGEQIRVSLMKRFIHLMPPHDP